MSAETLDSIDVTVRLVEYCTYRIKLEEGMESKSLQLSDILEFPMVDSSIGEWEVSDVVKTPDESDVRGAQ